MTHFTQCGKTERDCTLRFLRKNNSKKVSIFSSLVAIVLDVTRPVPHAFRITGVECKNPKIFITNVKIAEEFLQPVMRLILRMQYLCPSVEIYSQ